MQSSVTNSMSQKGVCISRLKNLRGSSLRSHRHAGLAWHHKSRPCSHRTAAAAPDTLVTQGDSQKPSIDFLGVLNDMQTVRGVLETAADPDLVYDVLTDYDSCSRVFRNISGSQTLFSEAGQKQVVQVSSRLCSLKRPASGSSTARWTGACDPAAALEACMPEAFTILRG